MNAHAERVGKDLLPERRLEQRVARCINLFGGKMNCQRGTCCRLSMLAAPAADGNWGGCNAVDPRQQGRGAKVKVAIRFPTKDQPRKSHPAKSDR